MATGIKTIEADGNNRDCRIAIVASQFNAYIVDRLLQGCLSTLNAAGIENSSITLVKVPGAFEIPVAAKKLATESKVSAIITLGAIVRGETPHFDLIAQACTNGIAQIALDTGLPVVFGVLTVDNVQQAMDRSGDEESNKGSESAKVALEMISVLGKIGQE